MGRNIHAVADVKRLNSGNLSALLASTYGIGDGIGGKVQFTAAAIRLDGPGAIIAAHIFSDPSQTWEIDLHLFTTDPAGTTGDDAVFTVAVADIGGYLGKIEMDALADLPGALQAHSVKRLTTPYIFNVSASDRSIWVVPVCRTVPTVSADRTFQVHLDVERW